MGERSSSPLSRVRITGLNSRAELHRRDGTGGRTGHLPMQVGGEGGEKILLRSANLKPVEGEREGLDADASDEESVHEESEGSEVWDEHPCARGLDEHPMGLEQCSLECKSSAQTVQHKSHDEHACKPAGLGDNKQDVTKRLLECVSSAKPDLQLSGYDHACDTDLDHQHHMSVKQCSLECGSSAEAVQQVSHPRRKNSAAQSAANSTWPPSRPFHKSDAGRSERNLVEQLMGRRREMLTRMARGELSLKDVSDHQLFIARLGDNLKEQRAQLVKKHRITEALLRKVTEPTRLGALNARMETLKRWEATFNEKACNTSVGTRPWPLVLLHATRY